MTMKTQKNMKELSDPPAKRADSALSTLRETNYVFELDAVQKTMKTEKNQNELLKYLSHWESLVFWELSTILGKVYVFWLDAVQMTMKTKKN